MTDKYDDMARVLFKKGAMSIQLLAASLRTCGQEAEKAIALLRRIEWSARGGQDSDPACPECEELEPTHANDCELAALIRKAP